MSKHTPGPWRFGIYNWEKNAFEEKPFEYVAPGYYDNPEIVGPNGESVVGCDEYCVFGSEANARLIASAPDLLDALLAALPFVEDAADDETYKAHRVHKVLKEIRKAIEKATGESCTS